MRGNRSFKRVVQGVKRGWKKGGVRNPMRAPDIIKGTAAGLVNLSEEKLLIMLRVQHDIELTGGCAFQVAIKTGLWIG